MKRETTTSTFEELTKTFLSRFGGGLICLVQFGSPARGESSGRSDWDIFLLAESLPDHPFERQIFLRQMIPKKLPCRVSIYAKTVKEFERDFPSIYLDIATDGIIIFDKNSYIQKKLQRIREIIQEADLKRIRKYGSLIWRWKEQPEVGWGIDWSGVFCRCKGNHRRTTRQTIHDRCLML